MRANCFAGTRQAAASGLSRRSRRLLLPCLVLMLSPIGLASCATTKVSVERPVAARVTLPGVKTIAVLPFGGRNSEVGVALADAIASQLQSSGHFTIVERTSLERVINEQALGTLGVMDEKTGAQVGRLVKADAVLTGNITGYDVSDSSEYHPGTYLPKSHTTTPAYTEYHRVATLNANCKLINVQTGALMATLPLTITQRCDGQDIGSLSSASQLLAGCVSQAASDVLRQISPHMASVEIAFDLGRGALKDDMKAAIEFSKAGLADKAAAAFHNLQQKYPNASAPIYNQGILAFLSGDLDTAESLISKSLELLPASKQNKTTWCDNKTYADMLRKIRADRANQQRINEQMIAKAPVQERQAEIIQTGATQPVPAALDNNQVRGASATTAATADPVASRPALARDSDTRWRRQVKVAVVIPEHVVRRPVPDPAGETAVLQAMIEAGFRCIEQTSIAEMRYNPEVAAAIKDATQAVALARKLKVDVIIIGEAISDPQPRTGALLNYKAQLEARAIHVDSGEIIFAARDYAAAADTSELAAAKMALEKAGTKVAQILISKLDQHEKLKGGISAGQRARQDDARVVTVTVDAVSLQMEANIAATSMGQAERGQALKVLDQVGSWFHVRMGNGTEGWVHEKTVSGVVGGATP